MAFNPLGKNIQQQVEECNEDFPEELQEKPISSSQDVEKILNLQQNAKIQTLKTLNALKIMHPIIIALMQKPGLDSEGKELSDGFFHLIRETSSIAEETCKKIGVDVTDEKNLWIRNVLEKTFAEFYKEEWVASGNIKNEFLHKIVDLVIECSDTFAPELPFEEIPNLSILKMSTIKSVLPWLKEANNFDLFRNIEQDIETVTEIIYSSALKGVDMLAEENATTKDKINIFNILSTQLGELYSVSWKAESNRIKDILSTLDEEKLNKHLQKYPNGLPIDKVNVDFERYYEKLLVVTEKLTNVSKKAGTIENRMKNK